MNFISENGEDYVLISNQSELDELSTQFVGQKPFAYLFKFTERQLFICLLETLKIDYEDFTKNYFHFDARQKWHISESEFGYIWISTSGLVARKKATSNCAVNACLNQYTVISLLIKKSIEIVEDERVYDIDSYNNGLLSELSPAIFHNLIFYVEVFYKAYLSLAARDIPHSHKLALLHQKTLEATLDNGHNNSLLQILILDPLYKLVEQISEIPIGFKEHFVKYDDNPMDDTVILFEATNLKNMLAVLELSFDFINDYFHSGTDTHYLRPNLYQKLLERAETEEQKERIRNMYSHLIRQ